MRYGRHIKVSHYAPDAPDAPRLVELSQAPLAYDDMGRWAWKLADDLPRTLDHIPSIEAFLAPIRCPQCLNGMSRANFSKHYPRRDDPNTMRATIVVECCGVSYAISIPIDHLDRWFEAWVAEEAAKQ